MKIEKNKYPIFLLEELENLINQLRKISKDYSWLISEEPGASLNDEVETGEHEIKKEKEYELMRFGYKGNGAFLFTIDHFQLEEENKEYSALFEIYKSPKNDKSIGNDSDWLDKQQIVKSFKEWINILVRYEKIKFQDPITEQYENEIYDVIKIVDKKADETSFDTEQQIFMLKYLDNAQKYLESESNNFETTEIIEDINDLKKNVTGLTKNSSMRRLSSVLAKAKKQGMSLFKELMIMFKKELMKKVLTEGFDSFEKLISLLQSLN